MSGAAAKDRRQTSNCGQTSKRGRESVLVRPALIANNSSSHRRLRTTARQQNRFCHMTCNHHLRMASVGSKLVKQGHHTALRCLLSEGPSYYYRYCRYRKTITHPGLKQGYIVPNNNAYAGSIWMEGPG